MEKVDCIVIGAGNGGLIGALNLVKHGKKMVLLGRMQLVPYEASRRHCISSLYGTTAQIRQTVWLYSPLRGLSVKRSQNKNLTKYV